MSYLPPFFYSRPLTPLQSGVLLAYGGWSGGLISLFATENNLGLPRKLLWIMIVVHHFVLYFLFSPVGYWFHNLRFLACCGIIGLLHVVVALLIKQYPLIDFTHLEGVSQIDFSYLRDLLVYQIFRGVSREMRGYEFGLPYKGYIRNYRLETGRTYERKASFADYVLAMGFVTYFMTSLGTSLISLTS